MQRGQLEVHPGMFPRGLMGVLGQYKRAVDYLFTAIVNSGHSADHCSYPLLYLMRHALEVGYKTNIEYLDRTFFRSLKGSVLHDVKYLHGEFVRLVEQQGEQHRSVITYIQEECRVMVELIDQMPRASSFRYTSERDGSSVFTREVLDVAEMKPKFDRAYVVLAHTPSVLHEP